MKTENEKFDKVLDLLRKSKPLVDSSDDIEREVIKRITRISQSGLYFSEPIDFLFRWIYIRWVRRSLITASIVLVMVFVYQQRIILKRIEVVSRQTVVVNKENNSLPAEEIEKLLMIYRNTGRRFPSKTITISESQLKKLLESVNELQIKYKDLENLIEGDPELEKLIEKKLNENNNIKINL
jgi:CHASE3 domain sensor protein